MATRLARIFIAAVVLTMGVVSMAAGQSNPRVAAHDQLKVTVVGVEQFSTKFAVGVDGAIEFPQLGRLSVSGLTAREVGDLIARRLKDADIMRNPQVTVELEQTPTKKVTVNGAVRTQGPVQFAGDLTLLEALNRAGGRLPEASDLVLVVRAAAVQPGALTADDPANPPMVEVNARDLEAGKLGANVVLRDGDAVFVRKAQAVTITGYVRNVGAYTVEPGSNVEQALALAGGISDRGSDRRIEITRKVNGKAVTLKDVKKTDLVQPGDIIKVGPKRV
jgi:polysaccharide export outer membrane protein